MKCICCESEKFETIYEGVIRSGSYGKQTENSSKIIKCENCGLTRIEDFPEIDYKSDEYRLDYNDTAQIEDYYRNHDLEQNPRINRIGIENFRNKVVLDFGCGGGSFLDLIKGFAKRTIAVEPFTGYHRSLKERGHEVYSSIAECDHLKGEIDIIISFGVIEHINEPLQYLSDARSVLKPGGKMFIETDNLNDVLINLNFPEFLPFYYRTVHSWYFDSVSLTKLSSKAGFSKITPGFRHGFGLSNTLLWLKERKPWGNSKIAFITEEIDFHWVQMLERSGMAELLHFELIK